VSRAITIASSVGMTQTWTRASSRLTLASTLTAAALRARSATMPH